MTADDLVRDAQAHAAASLEAAAEAVAIAAAVPGIPVDELFGVIKPKFSTGLVNGPTYPRITPQVIPCRYCGRRGDRDHTGNCYGCGAGP